MSTLQRLAVPVAFVVVIVSFSVNSIITRYLVSGGLVGAFPLTIIRFLSGLVSLQLLASGLPERLKTTKLVSRDIGGALFLGLYAFAISFGYLYVPASAGALVFYSVVVITMSTYSVVKDREKVSVRLVVGQSLGILGIFAVAFRGIGPASLSLPGVALMALTGASWGLYSVNGRKSGSYFGYTYNSFLIFGVANVVLIILGTGLTGTQQWTGISLPSLGLALYMGAISTALSYVVWNRVLKRVSASQGALSQLLVPVLTAVMGVIFLSEAITVQLVAGGALILAGIYINSSRKIEIRGQDTGTSTRHNESLS